MINIYVDTSACHIELHQMTERTRCFDVGMPFHVGLQRYYCTFHHSTFSILHEKIIGEAKKQLIDTSYVILPHTIITGAFLSQVLLHDTQMLSKSHFH